MKKIKDIINIEKILTYSFPMVFFLLAYTLISKKIDLFPIIIGIVLLIVEIFILEKIPIRLNRIKNKLCFFFATIGAAILVLVISIYVIPISNLIDEPTTFALLFAQFSHRLIALSLNKK